MVDRAESESPGNPAEATADPPRLLFISYASSDAEVAEKVCSALEVAGLSCWIAPRDVRPGAAYAAAIVNAINEVSTLVLVLSASSIQSDHVAREIERAASKRKQVIAFRIDAAPLSAELEYFLSKSQWIDVPALGMPTGLAKLREAASSGPPPADAAVPEKPLGHASGKRKLIAAAAAVVVLGVAVTIAIHFWPSKHGDAQERAVTAISNKSIAVLPFVDLSEKHDQEYFADGMAEEVIDLLTNIPGLKVIGRTSSFQFKGKDQDLRAIGTTLGVSYIVEGTVRRSGDRLRVTAQLINARDGSHMWSATYDEPAEDTLKVQDEIASNLARALQVSVGADIELTRSSFKSVEAYDLYLRGRHAYDRFDKEGFESAAAYFQQALELDPASVPAAEALAVAQTDIAESGFVEPHEGFERARASAQRALRLDPKSSLAQGNLGEVNLVYDWDWAAAERHAKDALRLKPRNHFALGLLGMVCEALGKWDESARLFETALTVDPLFAAWHQQLGNVRYAKGSLPEAEVEQRKTLQISPTLAGGHLALGTILLAQGKLEAALSEVQQEQPDSGRYAGLAIVYHAMGRRADSDAALAQQVHEHAQDGADGIADAYAYRGELDHAFAWLERAYRQKDSGLYLIKGDPFFKNLQADPRYKAFLHKMNLPE